MPPKRKNTGPKFHRDFKKPTAQERKDALGSFPCQHKANLTTRKDMLQQSMEYQPSIKEAEKEGNRTSKLLALSDLDERQLYIPTPKSETSLATPNPSDELDWLAQVPEEGQTYDDYLRLMTTRTSGRFKPLMNAKGIDILLLPIVDRKDQCSWPDYGPSLEHLMDYTQIFFDRPVHILPCATLEVTLPSQIKRKPKKQKTNPGHFATSSKRDFNLSFPKEDGFDSYSVKIAGRGDSTSERYQLKVDSVLDELAAYRYARQNSKGDIDRKEFCIMGITMIDLYDGPSDLFCAGMAFGGDKVAVFSFARYHPLLKMHPEKWFHYGYTDTSDGYSYYEDHDQNPKGLAQTTPKIISFKSQDKIEFLRRSCKLLTHELGHLYGIDHCIHNRCLMMGTGHLVEDFKAPSHLCGICLRKLQWRTGFNVRMRYKLLTNYFESVGMGKEETWARKQLAFLNK
ncbi:hypothetical protein CTEN210_10083 [Chaetoceros tenuissimus]|uniref:Archaemetzincin-2 n=1 Tax=Chaetoceros tenuissimus TaxID=426638 RepID=A0AAD3CWP9_9STRA|nr:hypothetical protein CTEN210_10083 [Chaetoceros tenuissimus]